MITLTTGLAMLVRALPFAPRLWAGATQRAFALIPVTVDFGMLFSGIVGLVAREPPMDIHPFFDEATSTLTYVVHDG